MKIPPSTTPALKHLARSRLRPFVPPSLQLKSPLPPILYVVRCHYGDGSDPRGVASGHCRENLRDLARLDLQEQVRLGRSLSLANYIIFNVFNRKPVEVLEIVVGGGVSSFSVSAL